MELSKLALDTINMFITLAVELTFLFIAISYFVGVLQEYIPPEKIKKILSGEKKQGFIIAAFLGAITPFCSCSTIPFLKGLIRAGAGFGPMLVFLFASPLLNPIVIGLFALTFGVKVTIFYFSFALFVSISAGYILDKFGFEKYLKRDSGQSTSSTCSVSNCGNTTTNKWLKIWNNTWKDFKKVSPYLLISVILGAIIHGFVPTSFIAQYAGESNPLAIPVASIIGIPLYVRASAMLPIGTALAAKGMGMGAIMSLIIGSAGASLTEVILLKSFFKNQMIIAFLIVVLSMAIGSGYAYNFLF